MRKINNVIITDDMEEAMLDAIDKFGIYAFECEKEQDKIMYVEVLDEGSLGKAIAAQEYLNGRCPEWKWFASVWGWCTNVLDVLSSSMWGDDVDE